MKNELQYFYNLNIDSVRRVENKYFIKVGNDNYYLIQTDETEDELEYKNELITNIPLFHRMVWNNNYKLLTQIGVDKYVLLKLNCKSKDITLDDIYYLNTFYFNIDKFSTVKKYKKLWSEKIDYMEYQISQVGKKYPIIRESFSYYDGLTENAIQMLEDINDNNIKQFVSHKRISHKNSTIDLYNPVDLILDSRVRDVSEYFKSKFFDDKDVYEEMIMYLDFINEDEIKLFFCRMLFPSYYFDSYEKILRNELEEKHILKYVLKCNEFEKLIQKLYLKINEKFIFLNIEWIKKT